MCVGGGGGGCVVCVCGGGGGGGMKKREKRVHKVHTSTSVYQGNGTEAIVCKKRKVLKEDLN